MKIPGEGRKSSLSFLALITISVLELAVIVALAVFYPALAGFDSRTVEPTIDFIYKDSLTCTIVYSTHEEGMSGIKLPWLDYETFTLTGLDTDHPQLLVNGKKRIGYVKDYDADTHLTLSESPQYWDSDVISLMKTTGSFVRTITGIEAGNWRFHYAVAQKGICQ